MVPPMIEQPLEDLRRAPRRTRALLHIATHPDASNRQVAAAIGIGSEAQVSRLLVRMQDLGLISNRAKAHNHGGPNSWELTADGTRLVKALKSGAKAPS
jgi:DNA-binding IclR family transcriptional regulator